MEQGHPMGPAAVEGHSLHQSARKGPKQGKRRRNNPPTTPSPAWCSLLAKSHWKPVGKGVGVGKSGRGWGRVGNHQFTWLISSCHLVLISSECLSLPPKLKDFSPDLFNSITLYFLHNTDYYLKSLYHLVACLFIVSPC